MDLTLLRSLLAVARLGAITDAAAALGVTQPALSRRIQQLEEELGAPLLVRSRKGVALTEMGRLAHVEALELVARFDRLKQDVRAHARLDAGIVRLGGGATAVSFLVPDALAAFQRRHPAVRFQVKEAGSLEIEADVLADRLELGVVTLPVRGGDLEARPLVHDEIVLVAARGHPLARARRVAPARLDGQGLVGFEAGSAIRALIDDALRDAGVTMQVIMELRSIPAIVRMVETTGNLAFISRLGVRRGERSISVVQVRGLQIRRQLAVISRRGRVPSPAAAAFVDELLAAGARCVGAHAPGRTGT